MKRIKPFFTRVVVFSFLATMIPAMGIVSRFSTLPVQASPKQETEQPTEDHFIGTLTNEDVQEPQVPTTVTIDLQNVASTVATSETIKATVYEAVPDYFVHTLENLTNASTEYKFGEYELSEEEIELIAGVTMAEAGNQTELGKRLVIDVIFNQFDSGKYGATIKDVIYYKNNFETISNKSALTCVPTEDIYRLIREECQSRTNYEVCFFRTKHYHTFGTPLFQEDDHFFSGF